MRNQKEKEDRWLEVLEYHKSEGLEFEKEFYDKRHIDQGGGLFVGRNIRDYADCFIFIGTVEYILYRDINSFKTNMFKGINISMDLFTEDNVKSECLTFFWQFPKLFFSLASGDIEMSKAYAKHTGGRQEVENEHDGIFTNSFGYTLKYFIEEDLGEAKPYLEKLKTACNRPTSTNFKGYPQVFEGILEKDINKVQLGFDAIIKGHIKECKGRGERYFKDTKEEDISIWGIGMANLCRYYGLNVQVDHPLIPAELLIEVSKEN